MYIVHLVGYDDARTKDGHNKLAIRMQPSLAYLQLFKVIWSFLKEIDGKRCNLQRLFMKTTLIGFLYPTAVFDAMQFYMTLKIHQVWLNTGEAGIENFISKFLWVS